MKRVFLHAYDRQNLGDDLFVHTIASRYPGVQFYMWSDRENRETFACLPNLKVVDKASAFVRVLQKVRPSLVHRYRAWLEQRCDAVVYIGGSIFMEYPNWENICSWWEYEAKNRPLYVLGANFGPWHTPAYRDTMAKIFAECRDVCFRDRYSAGLFPEVDTVRCAPDILFSHPMPRAPLKEKQIFVSVIHCGKKEEGNSLGQYHGRYLENMLRLLQDRLDAGHSLVLGSFCKEEGDEEAIGSLLEKLEGADPSQIRVLAYDGTNSQAMTTAIAESGMVIATRFHAAILAMAAGRPVLPIVYSDKTLHVLEDLGFAGAVYDLRQEHVWNWPPESGKQHVTADMHSARDHFQKLDKVLNEEN